MSVSRAACEGRHRLGHLAGLEVGAAQRGLGRQQLRVTLDRPLQQRDGLAGLEGLEPRLAQQEGQLRGVRLALQQVFQEGAGRLGVVGDEERRGQLAADPEVFGPGRRRFLQLLDRLAEEPPAGAEDLGPQQRGLRRRRQGGRGDPRPRGPARLRRGTASRGLPPSRAAVRPRGPTGTAPRGSRTRGSGTGSRAQGSPAPSPSRRRPIPGGPSARRSRARASWTSARPGLFSSASR